MGRIIEKWVTFIVSVLSGFLCFYLKYDFLSNDNFRSTLNSIISVSAVLIGFMSTMIAILISSNSSETIKDIRAIQEGRIITTLNTFFQHAIISGFVLALGSNVISLVLNNIYELGPLISVLWLLCGVYFIASTFRVVMIMLEILKQLSVDKPKRKTIYSDPDKAFPNTSLNTNSSQG